jgi:SPP1 gp7 family putative phage head morphogenesis protein
MRRDPTRTTMLRNSFVKQVNKRLRELRRAINIVVVDLDVFRLKPNPFISNELPFNFTSYGIRKPSEIEQILGIGRQPTFVADTSAILSAQSASAQLTAYQEWFKAQVDAGLLEVAEGFEDRPWTSPYVESAYKKGVVRSYNDVHGLAGEVAPFGAGSRAAFLQSAFGGPIGTKQIQLLATRAFQQLQGVTAAMEQNMSRILADGLAHGRGPREIARELNKTVSGLGRNRSHTIARTEIIHSYAEGQLDSYEQMNMEEVGVMAEWSTAGDDRVCELCSSLEGVVLEIKEARGIIPRHPNCRCAFIPALVGEKKQAGQKTRQDEIQKAINKSVKDQAPKGTSLADARKRSTWTGTRRKIAKDRTRTPSIVKPKPKPTPKPKPKPTPKPKPKPTPKPRPKPTPTKVIRATTGKVSNVDGKWQVAGRYLEDVISPQSLSKFDDIDDLHDLFSILVNDTADNVLVFAEELSLPQEVLRELFETANEYRISTGLNPLPTELFERSYARPPVFQVQKVDAGEFKPFNPDDVVEAPSTISVGNSDADDPFVKRMWNEIGQEGIADADHALRIGELIDEEIMKDVALQTQRQELIEEGIEFRKRKQNYMDLTDVGKAKYWDEYDSYLIRSQKFTDEYSQKVVETIGRIREVGGSIGELELSGRGQKTVGAIIKQVQKDLPTDWNKLISENVWLDCAKSKRGFVSPYSDTKRTISMRQSTSGNSNLQRILTEKDSAVFKDIPTQRVYPNRVNRNWRTSYEVQTRKTVFDFHVSEKGSASVRGSGVTRGKKKLKSIHSTTTHELSHLVEYSSGTKLTKLEAQFVKKRYAKSPNKAVGYEDGLPVLEDEFFHKYMGKLYAARDETAYFASMDAGVGQANSAIRYMDTIIDKYEDGTLQQNLEVFSMGIEGVLHGTDRLPLSDVEHTKFVLGILAGF